MQITVKLFAQFRQGRFKIAAQEVPPGTTPEQVLREIGIDVDELGITLINGRHAQVDTPLQSGDVLALFPLVGGG